MAYDANMKYITLLLLLVLLPLHAEVYRLQGEDGRVIYTDQYSPDAELVNLPEPATYKAPVVDNSLAFDDTPEEEPIPNYELTILSPQPDQALWANDGNVPVSVEVRPELNVEKGEKLIISLDGMEVGEPQQSTSFTVTILERGAHTVNVSLVDQSGSTLASQSVNFQVHRASIRNHN